MALPDFFISGAPKAGTTALHVALARHPSLYMSAVKEPKFFLTDGPPPTKGGPGDVQTYREHVWQRDDYEALFDPAPAGTLRGESTPFYLYDRDAQRRIQALIPNAKMIAILRDPVERAHSNWTHLWSAGLDPISDFVLACAEEERRIAAGWADFWRYTALGRYGEQLNHLYTMFPPEHVLVFRYRALIENPAQVDVRPANHLGILSGLNRLLEIIARAFHILIGNRHLRQNEQRPPLVANLLVKGLLGQFLRTLGIARLQPLLGRDQHLAVFHS